MGGYSPLAICAYLRRFGFPSGSKGYTYNYIDLQAEMKKQGKGALRSILVRVKNKDYGMRFEIELERPMSEPIRQLEKAGVPDEDA